MSVAEIASDVKVKSASRKLTKQQKAAAVIVSLGMDKASQLYKYMTPQDVERLTMEIAKLGYVDPDQTEGILDEYYQMCLTNKAVTEGGMEYARAVLERAGVGLSGAAARVEPDRHFVLRGERRAAEEREPEKGRYTAFHHDLPLLF